MSDTMPDNLIRKVRYTPLIDLLRGRVSGRLDVKGRIAGSKLPPEAKDLVWRVVKGTRLWTGEKIEVAEELMGHFEDGMAVGESAQELVGKFGDAKRAAKLIRRAKRRGRPIAWHVLRGAGWVLVGLIVVYGFLAARFVLGRPTIAVDYVAALNRSKMAMAEERGWPIYREALLALGNRAEQKKEEDRLINIFDARPGSEHWKEVGPWLAEHEKVVELTSKGSKRAVLGFVLGKEGAMRDVELYPGKEYWFTGANAVNDSVLSVPLPHLNDMKVLAEVLAVDARFAREQKDGGRVMRDIEALLKLSRQLHRDGELLVVDLVGLNLWEKGLNMAEEAVGDVKLGLSDGDLQKLAHMLTGPKVAGDLLGFAGERMMIKDVVQRCYTDDGNGDGHITLEGQKLLMEVGAFIGNSNSTSSKSGLASVWYDAAMWALPPAVGAGRKEVMAQYERLMDVADANLRRPIREAKWVEYQREATEEQGTAGKVRRPTSSLLVLHLGHTQNRAERFLGHRDGIVVGIALELWRRKHGEYPASLEALAGEYLPEIPADRFSGDRVRYRLVNGRPVIYSVGADGDDDGGRPPAMKDKKALAADWFVGKAKAPDGDWVLYPAGAKIDPQ